MDPLSTTASIIAVLQLSSEVAKYIGAAAGATKDRKRLRDEVRSCEYILQQLKDEVDDSEGGEAWLETIEALEAPDAPLGRLWVTLDVVRGKLQPKKGVAKVLASLKWSFDEKELEKILQAIEREKALLQLALNNNCVKLVLEIKKTANENKGLLKHLTPVIKANLNETRRRSREAEDQFWDLKGDLAVIQDSPEFKTWVETEKKTLYCRGIPGAGKTILTSIVVDELTDHFKNVETTGIAYVYCNFRRQADQQADDLLKNLLKQLADSLHSPPSSLRSLYDKHKDMRSRPSLGEISTALQSMTRLYSRVFIIMDALDECQASNKCRSTFLSEIFALQISCGANIFATSRHISEIDDKFSNHMSLEIYATTEDIERYLEGRMDQLEAVDEWSQELRDEIKSSISNAVEGMFLLAQIYLDSLDDKTTPTAVRAALKKLKRQSPGSSERQKREVLNLAYRDVMERINRQRPGFQTLANKALSWITCAKRPLTTSELQCALAVKAGDCTSDEDSLERIDRIVSVCAGLVTIDEESGIIRLVHYTVHEYFEGSQGELFPHAEADITTSCVTYLTFRTFESGICRTRDEFRERLLGNPLYDYAAHNWGYHARNDVASAQTVISFLESEAHVEASVQALMSDADEYWRRYHKYIPWRRTGLHLDAYFGAEYAVQFLLESIDTDCKDRNNRTPLSIAAEKGHDAVIKLLLATETVDVNGEDDQGRTPLSYAAECGHDAVVKLLLATQKIDVDFTGNSALYPPLGYATVYGHSAIVKLLLATGKVDVNSKNEVRRNTLLGLAVQYQREFVVKLLFATGKIDVNSKHDHGSTPLNIAITIGDEAVVKLLLATDKIDVNLQDYWGSTPLSNAIESGHEAIVKLLLATDKIDVNFQNKLGSTPLNIAAEQGKEAVVKLLLATEKIDVNLRDKWGCTPLSNAAENGHEAIAKLLLPKPQHWD